MKKFNLKTLLLVPFFIAFASSFSFSQTVAGKIYLKAEADSLFGPVQQFVKMPLTQFQALLDKCEDRMLFRFEDPDMFVLNEKREVLSSTGSLKTFNASVVMKAYSKSVIKELLSKGQGGSSISIEKRQNVTSVTYGTLTMENATMCPPDCPFEP